jgi:protein arginine N-methyltransferase 5
MRLRSAPWIFLSDVGPIPSPNDLATQTVISPADSGAGPWPLPSDSGKTNIIHNAIEEDPTPHLTYARWLQRKQPPKLQLEQFGAGYQDYLQAPLQPLADNLESITYEVFEKDPIKYEWYERAIAHALMDWATEEKATSSTTGAVVIAVVGSGRGPLVTRALRASEATGVDVEVWAIEKNPNAYVLLQRHNEFEWNRKVNVVKTDMRAWKGPRLHDGTFGHVDMLVSELLGSFADNELSPECLDGVQHVLNPDHGISIPASYTAHLTPISTPKLHSDLVQKSVADKEVFDLPYVVMLHQHDYLSTLPAISPISDSTSSATAEATTVPSVQTCWEFKHPISPTIIAQSNLRRGGSAAGGYGGTRGGDGANEHNSRFCHLTFPCAYRGTCHGLAGYFETVLYTSTDIDLDEVEDDGEDAASPAAPVSVELSTNPVTMDKKSKDMISWFPIYFPLRTPVSFPDNAEVDVSMWRCTDDRKVWYEWCVEAFVRLPASGERIRVAGGDVQSSRKNGCLM